MDSGGVLNRKAEILDRMRRHKEEKGFDLVLLMATDVMKEGTQILYVGDDESVRQAFNVIPKENTAFLPRIMSRKKQVIPMLSDLWT